MEGLGLFTGSLVVTSAFARVNLVYQTPLFWNNTTVFFGTDLIFFRTDAFSEKDERVSKKKQSCCSKKRGFMILTLTLANALVTTREAQNAQIISKSDPNLPKIPTKIPELIYDRPGI